MKTKIDVKEILENNYFDFNDISAFNFYVDGKAVSIAKLSKGVDINQEFSIETKNHCQFQYRDKNTFKPNYDARDIFQFGFKLVLNKIQFDLIEYWTCNGILRLYDDYVFDYMDTEDEFTTKFKDYIEETSTLKLWNNEYTFANGLYEVLQCSLFKFSLTGIHTSLESALTLLDVEFGNAMEFINEKYVLGRCYINWFEECVK